MYTLPKFNIAPEKMMVGRRSFPFGMVTFSGAMLNFRGIFNNCDTSQQVDETISKIRQVRESFEIVCSA